MDESKDLGTPFAFTGCRQGCVGKVVLEAMRAETETILSGLFRKMQTSNGHLMGAWTHVDTRGYRG